MSAVQSVDYGPARIAHGRQNPQHIFKSLTMKVNEKC